MKTDLSSIEKKIYLNNLLNPIEDCFYDLYFLTKQKMKTTGLQFSVKNNENCIISNNNCIFFKTLKDSDFTFEFMYYRKFFPFVLLFENDHLEIIKNKIFLKDEDSKRILIENQLLERDYNFNELVTRLDLGFRLSLEQKSIFDFFRIKSENFVKDYEKINKNNFWSQINDLQKMYEISTIIQSGNKLENYIDIVSYIKEINRNL